MDIDFQLCMSNSNALTWEEIVEMVLSDDKDQNEQNLEDDDDDKIDVHEIPLRSKSSQS